MQLICSEVSVTEPLPVPIRDTFRVNEDPVGTNVALSLWFPFRVMEHCAVPLHVLQPLKVVPAAGVPVSVTTEPVK